MPTDAHLASRPESCVGCDFDRPQPCAHALAGGRVGLTAASAKIGQHESAEQPAHTPNQPASHGNTDARGRWALAVDCNGRRSMACENSASDSTRSPTGSSCNDYNEWVQAVRSLGYSTTTVLRWHRACIAQPGCAQAGCTVHTVVHRMPLGTCSPVEGSGTASTDRTECSASHACRSTHSNSPTASRRTCAAHWSQLRTHLWQR